MSKSISTSLGSVRLKVFFGKGLILTKANEKYSKISTSNVFIKHFKTTVVYQSSVHSYIEKYSYILKYIYNFK